MNRNCNNCKALQKCVSELGCECKLGYKIEITNEYEHVPISYKPLEVCPKPKTYQEYVKCLNNSQG